MNGARLVACWLTRGPAGVDVEARRLAGILSAIGEVDAELGRWVLHDASERETPCSAPSLAEALRKGARAEPDRALGTVRGHLVVCRARGRLDIEAELRATVGVEHDGPRSAWVPNRIVLAIDRAVSSSAARRMLDVLVRATDPRWALVDGGGVLQAETTGVPGVGWITYLHRSQGRPRTRVDGVEVVPRGEGRVVQLVKDPPDDPIELADRIEAIRRALLADGVLRPHAEVVQDPRDFEPDEIAPQAAAVQSPVTPSPVASSPAAPPPAAPSPAVPPRIIPLADALGETQPTRAQPGGPSLPFQASPPGGAPLRRSPVPAPAPHAHARGSAPPADALGTTAPLAARPVPATPLPFAAGARHVDASAPPAAGPGPAALSLEQYASLCAWLEAEPQDRVALLARHHVPSEAAFAALDADYRARFATDPALHGRWAGLVMRYREAFARFPGVRGAEPR